MKKLILAVLGTSAVWGGIFLYFDCPCRIANINTKRAVAAYARGWDDCAKVYHVKP